VVAVGNTLKPGAAGGETGAGVMGGNNSAVEVVSWRQKIETWLWSKLWAIEHRLLRMISLYRLYFTALATGSAILASIFSMLYNALLSRAISAYCVFCGIICDCDIFAWMAILDWDNFLLQLASSKLSHLGLSSLLE
jgi:hypothetical protein